MTVALGALIAASSLAAAELGNSSGQECAAGSVRSQLRAPSKLDYMLLASLVDSRHLLSMAGYRATAQQGMMVSGGKIAPDCKPAPGIGRP